MLKYSLIDTLLIQADQVLRTLLSKPSPQRENPAAKLPESQLSAQEKKHVVGLMRVNHAGEICAQALYQGQALTARVNATRERLQESAQEEIDHLAWCEERIHELGGHTSYLNIFWYMGALTMGTLAGIAGDQWSLGFVAETEHQVVKHLNGHLNKLPVQDQKTQAIMEQMRLDETAHGDIAKQVGAAELPEPVKIMMSMMSKVMTTTAYWV